MHHDSVNSKPSGWKEYEKILFRFFFIYFFLQTFPLDWKYYRHLLSVDWFSLNFRQIFSIAKYSPQFYSGSYDQHNWGLATFSDWGLIFLFAVTGAVIWSQFDKKRTDYQLLYTYLRILVRYRLAIAVIAYGFLKLFSIQAPYPSISSLNTPYGDFTSWKIFSLSLGIVPGYQSFLGAVELIAGISLLFRKTAVIGATIIIFFIGNVFMSNLAYGGGEIVYSFYLVTLALFLIAYDSQRIINLIILNLPVEPDRLIIHYGKSQNLIRIIFKSVLILVFVVIYGFSAHHNAEKGGYHFSSRPGIKGVSGLYTVNSFSFNGRPLPYSLTDTLRWQNVVFEKWNTLSIKVNGSHTLLNDSTEWVPRRNEQSLFEQSGTVGRNYYSYAYDPVHQTIKLKNKIQTNQSGRLHYVLQPDSTIILNGVINGDSVLAVLQKDKKKYLLKAAEKGRRGGLKL